MVQRLLILAFLALSAGVGCNAGNSGGQLRQPATVSKETLSATRIIAQINKNAGEIKSLEAEPAIEATIDGKSHPINGRMRMEREKDFRLLLTALNRNVADIGSNDNGFWFWVKDQDKKENNLYVCDYEHVGNSRLSVAMQPDWIMEAMGLREISTREAATIDARPGDVKGQLLLTQLRKGSNGATYTKETLVNENTGEIIEHRLYSGAKKELLARATIKGYNQVAIKSGEDGEEVKVTLPSRFVLDFVTENFKLDITMSRTKVNPRFSKEDVAFLFSEPPIPGARRVDLATIAPAPSATSSRIYESMPMPRSGIRLGKPQALPAEDNTTSSRSLTRFANKTVVNGLPDLPESTAVVGPSMPQGSATDPSAVQASARGSWQRPAFEN
jgi:hypothetical protein